MHAARIASDPARHAAWVAERLRLVPPEVPEAVCVLLREMVDWTPAKRPTAQQVSALRGVVSQAQSSRHSSMGSATPFIGVRGSLVSA